MIRILIADDHAIVRHGLKRIAAECSDMKVTGEAASGAEALHLARNQEFDVAVVDITMPDRGGLEILKELKEERPRLGIVVLSVHSEEQYAIRCLRDGALAYLTKSSAPDELVQAIRAVANGRRYITPSVAERLASYIEADRDRLPHETLSDREMQVLVALGNGKSVGEIAGELALSAKTVSTYRARLLEKMSMESNAALIRYAVEHHLT